MRSTLMVVEGCRYGLARHVLELSMGLLERGWRVGLLYSPVRGVDSRLVALPQKEKAFQIFACPMDLWPSYRDVRVVREILKAISTTRADVVHCHSVKAGFVGRIAAAIAGIPSVYTPNALLCMSPSFPSFTRTLAGWYEAAFSYLGDCFLATSEEEKACALDAGAARNRIRLVPNGIPIPPLPRAGLRADMRGRFGLAPQVICAGFVGRLTEQKAVDNLVRAVQVVHASRPATLLKVLVVGDGHLRTQLETLSRDLGVQDVVTWAGELPGWEAMAAMDVFVLPSDYEGMPYVLLEAMAAGLPVVTTEIGGSRMLVNDGVNGRIVPRRDPQRLAQALMDLEDVSAATRQAMGAASRQHVLGFSAERMVDGVVEAYNALLGGRGPDTKAVNCSQPSSSTGPFDARE